jgi:hypothetical protein
MKEEEILFSPELSVPRRGAAVPVPRVELFRSTNFELGFLIPSEELEMLSFLSDCEELRSLEPGVVARMPLEGCKTSGHVSVRKKKQQARRYIPLERDQNPRPFDCCY